MGTILSLQFQFRGVEYYALVRIKQRDSCIEHHVTIMNGDLERMLYGNHIFIERDGNLETDPSAVPTDEFMLRQAVCNALSKYHQEMGNANLV